MTPLAWSALAWAGLHHPLVSPLRTETDRLLAHPPGPDRDHRTRVLLSACRRAERALDAQDHLSPGSTRDDRRLLATVLRDLLGLSEGPDAAGP